MSEQSFSATSQCRHECRLGLAVTFSDVISWHSPYCHHKYQMPLTNLKLEKADGGNYVTHYELKLRPALLVWMFLHSNTAVRMKLFLFYFLTVIKVWITAVSSYSTICRRHRKQQNNLLNHGTFKYFPAFFYFHLTSPKISDIAHLRQSLHVCPLMFDLNVDYWPWLGEQ